LISHSFEKFVAVLHAVDKLLQEVSASDHIREGVVQCVRIPFICQNRMPNVMQSPRGAFPLLRLRPWGPRWV